MEKKRENKRGKPKKKKKTVSPFAYPCKTKSQTHIFLCFPLLQNKHCQPLHCLPRQLHRESPAATPQVTNRTTSYLTSQQPPLVLVIIFSTLQLPSTTPLLTSSRSSMSRLALSSSTPLQTITTKLVDHHTTTKPLANNAPAHPSLDQVTPSLFTLILCCHQHAKREIIHAIQRLRTWSLGWTSDQVVWVGFKPSSYGQARSNPY